MATEQQYEEGFGQVSRLKSIAFEYLTFGASLIGVVALATLLVYVTIDAFDLANASPQWLGTYFVTLVVPFVAFCLYSADDHNLTRTTVTALISGLIATAVIVRGFELIVRPIPRLSWHLAYLFAVVIPVTGYVAVGSTRGAPARVGFGLLGQLICGSALGLALVVLFHVLDARLWFLAYTMGVFPAGLMFAYSRRRSASRVTWYAIAIGIGGVAIAAVLRNVLRTYPTTVIIYAWTLVIPISIVGAWLVNTRGSRTAAIAACGIPLVVAVGGGLTAGALGGSGESTLLVLAAGSVPTIVYVHKVFNTGDGRLGLSLPLLLASGAIVGTLIVQVWGVPAPDPWLDASYVTSAPSRNAADAGLYPAIVGSVIIIALVAVLSFAFGVGTAVFLEEYTAGSGFVGAITRIVKINIANLAAVPSVVYGLLGLGLFANLLGLGFGTAVTAALTLSLLILPITIISAQEAIRAVPDDLRQGSDAMGATRWQTTRNVVLPEALPGILTGTILALGRAIGETAPLIMIGAATTVFSPPGSLWSKFSAMPMQIFAWADYPQAEFRYGVVAAGVVTLLIVLLGMNATAIIIRNRTEESV